MKTKRLHDDLYLYENRYNDPKECFKDLIKILKNKKIKKNISFADIGCSNGELVFNIAKKFKDWSITGYDVKKNLLKKAKLMNPLVNFRKIDISKKEIPNEKYDIITMSGVLSIFDKPEKILKNCLKLLKKKGSFFVFGHFNPHPIDVYIKYKEFNAHKNILQSGWNIFSLKAMKIFSKKNKLKLKIFPFNIKININKNVEDPVRSWTFKNFNKKNLITNGLCIIQHQYWIEFTR
jgi:ubiquinone/menaquinone biosynthesis C-methylase UbiE